MAEPAQKAPATDEYAEAVASLREASNALEVLRREVMRASCYDKAPPARVSLELSNLATTTARLAVRFERLRPGGRRR